MGSYTYAMPSGVANPPNRNLINYLLFASIGSPLALIRLQPHVLGGKR